MKRVLTAILVSSIFATGCTSMGNLPINSLATVERALVDGTVTKSEEKAVGDALVNDMMMVMSISKMGSPVGWLLMGVAKSKNNSPVDTLMKLYRR